MIDFLLYPVGANLILVSSLIYIWHDLVNKKINFKDKRLYITFFSIVIISILNYLFVDKFIKIILITIVFMIFFRYLFKENLQKCIITPIFYQLVIMISETIYAMIIIPIVGNNSKAVMSTCFGTFLTNVIISVFSILIFKIKFVRRAYDKLMFLTSKVKINKLLIFSLFVIIIGNILAVVTYYKFNFIYIIIITSLITLICCIIVIYLFVTQERYNKVSKKYDMATKSLNEYEKMMNKYRISNHENKNLLLTIRAMIVNNDESIPEYINTIIKERYEDDEKLLFEMSAIPVSGLKATIYSEILKIKDKNIKYQLSIDKKLRATNVIDLDDELILDMCKIICVFIDNAIDEVEKMKSKSKSISISLYKKSKKLYIKISNNYENKINVEKIFNEGFSTKGKNRGFGLALVKKIIEKNDKIENKIELSKKVFSQIIIIDL